MDALDLHVEQRVRADRDAVPFADQPRQVFLVPALGAREVVEEAAVVGQPLQLGDVLEVADPFLADRPGDQLRQRRVALVQPAPRRDAVGHVDDAVGVHAVQVAEHGLRHQLGVQLGHAVDLVRADEGEVAHAHRAAVAVVVVDRADRLGPDVELPAVQFLDEELVDAVDDLQVARQHAAEHLQRPALQRLGQQRVVGVGDAAAGDVEGLLHAEAVVVDQQPHQLRHRDRRVRVVQLDGGVLGQRAQVVVRHQVAPHQVLQRGRGEEVLLLEAQFTPLRRRVVGVQHARERFGEHLVLGRGEVVALVELRQVEGLRGLGRPQPQRVDVARAPAGDRHVVADRDHALLRRPVVAVAQLVIDLAAERDLVAHLGAGQFPGIAALDQPLLGFLDLPTLLDVLAEQAVLVADAVAIGRDAERRQRVHEAGRQAPEAAVAERRVGLLRQDLVVVDVQVLERGLDQFGHAEVVDRVLEQAPDQEFHRQVVDALAVLAVDALGRLHPAVQQVLADGVGQRHVPVVRHGVIGILADAVNQALEDGPLEVFFFEYGDHESCQSCIITPLSTMSV